MSETKVKRMGTALHEQENMHEHETCTSKRTCTSMKHARGIEYSKQKNTGGDALRDNTRSHPEHDGKDLSGR